MEQIETIESKVIKKFKNNSDNPKAPFGFAHFDGLDERVSIWQKHYYNVLVIGGLYKITFKVSIKEYGNQTYKNYSLVDVIDKNIDVERISFSKEDKEFLKEEGSPKTEELEEGNETDIQFNLMGYPVEYGDVDKIVMPKDVLFYILQLRTETEFKRDKEDEDE